MRRLLLVENLTLVAIILGVVAGFYLPDLMLRLRILGDVFIALLKMIIVPLVFTSVFIACWGSGT